MKDYCDECVQVVFIKFLWCFRGLGSDRLSVLGFVVGVIAVRFFILVFGRDWTY